MPGVALVRSGGHHSLPPPGPCFIRARSPDLRVPARQQPVGRCPQRIEIVRGPRTVGGGSVAAEPQRELPRLRGAIGRSAREPQRGRERRGTGVPARAEVGEEGSAIAQPHQHIVPLHVSVDTLLCLHLRQRPGQLRQLQAHLRVGGVGALGPLVQRQALQPLHGHVREHLSRGVLPLSGVLQARDARVSEAAQQLRLLREARVSRHHRHREGHRAGLLLPHPHRLVHGSMDAAARPAHHAPRPHHRPGTQVGRMRRGDIRSVHALLGGEGSNLSGRAAHSHGFES
jgi:hypothetical protein